ncbi:hypothetical protein [Jeotgalibaca porci]|uniref:hypothetical protein n=1 Tax=Jeotgalibaca porci TaxID=1868793 RepID=UPI0035A02AD8
MIHLFWIIPFLISVLVGVIAKRQDDDVTIGVAIAIICFLICGAFSFIAIVAISETAYTDKVKFIKLNDIPYIVKITEANDGWQKDLLNLTDSYEFIEVAE